MSGPLRARVHLVIYPMPPGHPDLRGFEWDTSNRQFAGSQPTLEAAVTEAREVVRTVLRRRRTNIEARGNIVADCPKCGDPMEIAEQVTPGGGANYSESCESCGHDENIGV